MGLVIPKDRFDAEDHAAFADRLHQDLRALERLLKRPGFGEGPTTLGAEVELALVDHRGVPLPLNRPLLAQTVDPHLQLELDRFNLEYNLSPVPARGAPFAAMESEIASALGTLGRAARKLGGRVIPIGILPTLRPDDLQHSALTDLPRYRALSNALRDLRGAPFRVHIDGADPLQLECDDVTLEGATTSLQVHVRVPPADFARTFNAGQLVTPLAVAVGANSPTFLGHRLWDETRIALFKQAVDSRARRDREWHAPARVSFGHGWVREGAYELFAESVALFPPLLPVVSDEDPVGRVDAGEIPDLDELRLHQGTVWRWNRAIYDGRCGGHLRIELRALPAGPTPVDMLASAAFLLGLTWAFRGEVADLLPGFPFELARHSFHRAAQHGLDAILLWPTPRSPSPREVPAPDLIREVLPRAEEGLDALGVDARESARLLHVIAGRLETGTSPARWQMRQLDRLERDHGLDRTEALSAMLEEYVRQASTGRPAHEWGDM